jgi:two-component system sensor histidine kinase RegB
VNNPSPETSRTYSPSLENLRTLLLIRSLALLGQTAVLAYVLFVSDDAGELLGLALSLLVMAAITVASLWRTSRPWPVADREFLAQLLVDVLGWTALMYFSGGANNPFVSYYIVPLVIAAAVLPWRDTWLIAGSSLLAYSALLYFHLPFPVFSPHAAMGHGDGASMHILGMWFNFLFSAGLITFFVVRMAATLRQQEVLAVARREDQLRDDQIMAVAALAAGTAHQLGTPLSTMTVLLDEMMEDDAMGGQTREDCKLLKSQIAHCKNTLSELSRTAELSSVHQTRSVTVGDFTRETLQRWAVQRPGVVYELECATGSPMIEIDPTLPQALENLLNNAADTGSEKMSVTVSWDQAMARITIRDWGPGIPPAKLEQLGKPIIHADRSGLGIGLMLSQASVERHGGHIELRNHREGGAVATLALPIAGKTERMPL